MLSEIIVKYNKAKFEMVNRFSDNCINICEESLCIDKGYLKSKFEDFQKQYKEISNEIENLYNYGDKDDYNKSKISTFINTRDNLCLDTAYLVSNDIDNIDLSKKLIQGLNTDLKIAIEGIESYFIGNKQKANECLKNYYSGLNVLPNHYLINKVYGMILFERKEYELSIELMRIAVGINPSDLDLHVKLREMYELTNNADGYKVEDKIIKLLEG